MDRPAEAEELAHPKLRSAESRERFDQQIKDAFLMAGDREPIGEVLSYLASVAFEAGLGRDQAARQITTSDVFQRKGLVEGPLKACIRHEIQAAYAGKKGRREFSVEQRTAALNALKVFLENMNPGQSVTGFFRDLVNGCTDTGPILTDAVGTTVSQGNLLRWAIGLKTTRAIKRRFKDMVHPVISERFREYIKSKPEQYIANFLNDVFTISTRDDPPRPTMNFQIANLKELFVDIADAVDFQTFWKIFNGHAQAAFDDLKDSMSLEGAAGDFLNIELWRLSVETIWKEVQVELRQRNGSRQPSFLPPARTLRGVIDGARREAAAVSKLFFVILPPGTDGGAAASKMTVEIQDRRGTHVGRAVVKPNIRDSSPEHVRRFVRNLLTEDGSLAKSLRAIGIRLDRDGPEIHALANQLSSYRPPSSLYSNGRRRHSKR
ncbi:hypothetical protein HYW83_00785 [Candidatus Peregrinibacteria bacterium]|nr:hypothetical protein [Candidatus Peregrinibacteria bacterium]